MAIKFQYNKTSLAELDKQLKMRMRALPTIKNKESALRLEVKKAKEMAAGYADRLNELLARYSYMMALWGEFDPELLRIRDVELSVVKIAGVRIPVLNRILFDEKPYDLFSTPLWIVEGIAVLEQLAQLGIAGEFYAHKMRLLEHARKKTTQKVNLYEKVQIPGYEHAIRKIKRFMEDEENLSKSAQKIVKNKREKEEAAP